MFPPPHLNVTTGVPIVSLAVNVSVTSSPTLARVVVELFDAMPKLYKVGGMRYKETKAHFEKLRN